MANSNKIKISEKVKDAIQEMIFKNMQAGDKLPTESELTELFSASRTTIREALKSLEASKIVEKRNGGTFVASQSEECFVDPLCIMLQFKSARQSDIMDIRELLETEAAGRAALNADENEICELENIVWMMQKPGLTLKEFIDLDVSFHFLIAEASKNLILSQLVKDISKVLVRLYPQYCTLEIAKKQVIPLQINILNAIKCKDEVTARDNMRKHLQEAKEIIKL